MLIIVLNSQYHLPNSYIIIWVKLETVRILLKSLSSDLQKVISGHLFQIHMN